MTPEKVTEDELKAHQAKVGGKRVTEDALDAAIKTTTVFTAHQGEMGNLAAETFAMAKQNGFDDIKLVESFFEPVQGSSLPILTIAVLELQNGYTVLGQSACADPSMFNADIGERLAIADAKQKIWGLLGYALRDELYKAGLSNSFNDRVRLEHRDLQDKYAKLSAFIGGNQTFKNLAEDQQQDLVEQHEHMGNYLRVLERRISKFPQ